MSMVSDALKKAQAQATLGQTGLRLDLTGMGGQPPRRGRALPIVAVALVVGAMVGVAVPAGIYLARGGGEAVEVAAGDGAGSAEGNSEAAGSDAAEGSAPPAAAGDSSTDASGGAPILAVEPFRRSESGDGAGAGASGDLALGGAGFELPDLDAGLPAAGAGDASVEPAADRGAAGDRVPGADGRGDDREADRPRPALEAGAEYRGVLDVAEQPRLELTGIVWSQFTKIALINGSNAEPGDIVDGLRLVEIEPQRVRLRTPDSTEFYLRLR